MFTVSIMSGASQPRALQYILVMQLFSPCLAAAVPDWLLLLMSSNSQNSHISQNTLTGLV